MSLVTVLVIVALIGVALLLLVVGLIFYFSKRGKGGAVAAQPSVPGPHQAGAPPLPAPHGQTGFGAPDAQAGAPWGQPPQEEWGAAGGAQEWGAAAGGARDASERLDVLEPQQYGMPNEAPQYGVPNEAPYGAQNDAPPSAYRTQESVNAEDEQQAFITTPGTAPPPAAPNPDLYLTTPSAPRRTSMMDMKAHLQADDGTVIPLDRLLLRVGRHPECDIVVPTPGASRQHAEFEFRDGSWTVTDLNSGNGTWVNGVRVDKHQLAPGDEVRVDQTRFRFTAG